MSHWSARCLPQATDLEELVLGAILLEQQALPQVLARLQSIHFYRPANCLVFEAINHLYGQGKAVDLRTVTRQLQQKEHLTRVGGAAAVAALTKHVASAAHVEYHCKVILEKYLLRETIKLSEKYSQEAFAAEDAFDLLDQLVTEFLKLRSSITDTSIQHIAGVASDNLHLLEKLSRQEIDIVGLPTGFNELDRLLSGLQGGTKIEIAGRPGMGKSALALSIINHLAVDQKQAVALFSLEMPIRQQEMRLKSIRTQIPFYRLQKGKVFQHEWSLLNTATQEIAEAPLFIDDSGTMTTTELRSKCLQLKHEHDLQLVVIDYMQLMRLPDNGKAWRNKENEIAEISRATKQLAIDLNIPVIEISQLNRNAENRSDKRPQLSDLRDSGAIEQDADVVLFPFRPGYYDQDATDPHLAELIIAKHRNGACKTMEVSFIPDTVTFKDIVAVF